MSLFGHAGKVLVEHDGAEECVSEREIKGHTKHGDGILNPADCSNTEEER